MPSTETPLLSFATRVMGILINIAKELRERCETEQFSAGLAGTLSLIHESLRSKSNHNDHKFEAKINSLLSNLERLCQVSQF
jgi:hypothetical protein